MANTIELQTIVDGPRHLVVKVHIHGEAAGSDESETVLIDASTYTPAFTSCTLIGIHSSLVGFTAELLWDATTNISLIDLPDYEYNLNGHQIGWFSGIPNNAAAGKTGDILITTTGMTTAADHGTIILELRKD